MAVTGFKIVSGRVSKFQQRGRKYTYVYHVYVDDLTTNDINDIYLAGSLDGKTFPKIGDTHPQDSTAFCTDVEIKEPRNSGAEPDDRLRREVMVTYATVDPQSIQQQPQQGNEPEKRRPIRSRSSVDITVPIKTKADGSPLRNSAGFPFSPPPTAVIKSPVFTFKTWRRTFTDDYAAEYEGKLNDVQIGRYERGVLRCNRIQAVDTWEPGWGLVFEVTYEFQANPLGWQILVQDTGLVAITWTGDPLDADYNENRFDPSKWPTDASGNDQWAYQRINFGSGFISSPAYLKNGVAIPPENLDPESREPLTPVDIDTEFYEYADFTEISEIDFS